MKSRNLITVTQLKFENKWITQVFVSVSLDEVNEDEKAELASKLQSVVDELRAGEEEVSNDTNINDWTEEED